MVSAGLEKASHRRRFSQLCDEDLGAFTVGRRQKEAEGDRVKRIALCMTGQVKGVE